MWDYANTVADITRERDRPTASKSVDLVIAKRKTPRLPAGFEVRSEPELLDDGGDDACADGAAAFA
ncbi:hypothetical protein, partial [Sinorhizobium meliloti]|uniref:hypothetical protein n=1 Tax=Rhizobium meliloti TaxID=382 RepID=UPI001AECBEDC